MCSTRSCTWMSKFFARRLSSFTAPMVAVGADAPVGKGGATRDREGPCVRRRKGSGTEDDVEGGLVLIHPPELRRLPVAHVDHLDLRSLVAAPGRALDPDVDQRDRVVVVGDHV